MPNPSNAPTKAASDAKQPGLGRSRPRDAEASRAAILAAAREVFAERGYAGATIREIALRAGFTHGLVMRHFGTKDDLLVAALPGPRDLPKVLPGELATLPDRLAATFVEQTEAASGDHALIALLRSAGGNDHATMRLSHALRRSAGDAYRDVLPGPDAEIYIDLLISLLLGVTFTRHIARAGAIAQMTPEQLTAHLAPAIRGVLSPLLGAP